MGSHIALYIADHVFDNINFDAILFYNPIEAHNEIGGFIHQRVAQSTILTSLTATKNNYGFEV